MDGSLMRQGTDGRGCAAAGVPARGGRASHARLAASQRDSLRAALRRRDGQCHALHAASGLFPAPYRNSTSAGQSTAAPDWRVCRECARTQACTSSQLLARSGKARGGKAGREETQARTHVRSTAQSAPFAVARKGRDARRKLCAEMRTTDRAELVRGVAVYHRTFRHENLKERVPNRDDSHPNRPDSTRLLRLTGEQLAPQAVVGEPVASTQRFPVRATTGSPPVLCAGHAYTTLRCRGGARVQQKLLIMFKADVSKVSSGRT